MVINMSSLIEVKNLCKDYGEFALDNVSFTLEPGYIMGFVGPNGSGKSTTIKLILNLLRKDSGEIRLFGLDYEKNECEIKQKIGFVLDDTYFYDGMTIKQVGWLVSGLYDEWDNAKFKAYLEKYGLSANKKVKTLSTGMKAKLSLAVALSHNARLLILDEPTSGLDPVVRNDILSELFSVVQDSESGVFFSTHITSDLDKVADFVTFIQNGKILLTTTKDDINENYALVKGPKSLLPEVRGFVLRYRESEFGFEALTNQAFKLKGMEGILVEKAKIEDLMLHFERGETVC